MIAIRKHQKVYGNTIEMNQPQTVVTILLIFLLIIMIVFRSNSKKNQQVKQETMAQKVLK